MLLLDLPFTTTRLALNWKTIPTFQNLFKITPSLKEDFKIQGIKALTFLL